MTSGAIAGRHKDTLDTPALLVDLDRLERNIERMQSIVAGAGVALRPHVKTHKCPEIARLQAAAGARGVCCAKLGEAETMAAAGIDDLLVTTPIAGSAKLQRAVEIARRAKLSVVADDAEAIRALSQAAGAGGVSMSVVVEVNVGQDRCGVPPGVEAARLAQLVEKSPGLRFAGLQGYHGRLQGIASYEARRAEVRAALERLMVSVEQLRHHAIACSVLTGGGTGSAALDVELRGLTELQPGSYVYMDSSYGKLAWDMQGAPIPFEQSLSVLSSVVSRPVKERAVLDAGWKSLSCDSGMPVVRGLAGTTFEFAGDEHGTLRGIDAMNLRPGDRVELIPSHCDTTVNLYDRVLVCRGDVVVDAWTITGRGRSQ